MKPERVAIRCPECDDHLAVTYIPATEQGDPDDWLDGRGCPCEVDADRSVSAREAYVSAVLERARAAIGRRAG